MTPGADHTGEEDGVIRAVVQLGAVHRSAGSPVEGIAMIQELTRRLEQNNPAPAATELYIVLETLKSAVGRHKKRVWQPYSRRRPGEGDTRPRRTGTRLRSVAGLNSALFDG